MMAVMTQYQDAQGKICIKGQMIGMEDTDTEYWVGGTDTENWRERLGLNGRFKIREMTTKQPEMDNWCCLSFLVSYNKMWTLTMN